MVKKTRKRTFEFVLDSVSSFKFFDWNINTFFLIFKAFFEKTGETVLQPEHFDFSTFGTNTVNLPKEYQAKNKNTTSNPTIIAAASSPAVSQDPGMPKLTPMAGTLCSLMAFQDLNFRFHIRKGNELNEFQICAKIRSFKNCSLLKPEPKSRFNSCRLV